MSRYRDRRPDFKRAVYRGDMPAGTKVLLLRLLDDMNHKLIVSVPRRRLAEDLNVDPSRISEATTKAKNLGYLDVVKRGRPGTTAVYQGMLGGAESAPQSTPQHGAENSTCHGAESAPQNGGHMVRNPCTQVGNGSLQRNGHLQLLPPRGSYEEEAGA